jgi:chromosome segregation ATPase
VTQSLQTSASELRSGSELLHSATGGLRELAERLQSGVQHLTESLRQMLEQARLLTTENTTTGQRINAVLTTLSTLQNTFTHAASTVTEAASAAREQTAALHHHQQQLFIVLKEHIEHLQQQVTQLLTDYAQQVQGQTQQRLNEWNKQTEQFTGTMVAAVQSLAGIVEEIETKTGRPR